jgi:hypothetical protein
MGLIRRLRSYGLGYVRLGMVQGIVSTTIVKGEYVAM